MWVEIVLSNDKKVELIGTIEAERVLNHSLALDASWTLGGWNYIGLDREHVSARASRNSTTFATCRAASR